MLMLHLDATKKKEKNISSLQWDQRKEKIENNSLHFCRDKYWTLWKIFFFFFPLRSFHSFYFLSNLIWFKWEKFIFSYNCIFFSSFSFLSFSLHTNGVLKRKRKLSLNTQFQKSILEYSNIHCIQIKLPQINQIRGNQLKKFLKYKVKMYSTLLLLLFWYTNALLHK